MSRGKRGPSRRNLGYKNDSGVGIRVLFVTGQVHCATNMEYIMIYLLTAIGLTSGGSSTVHVYTQTIHRTTQLTTLVERLSGIRTQTGQTKINDELTA